MPKDKNADTEPVQAGEEPKPGEAGFDWPGVYGTDDLYLHTFGCGTVVALKSFKSIFSKTWLYKIRSLKTNVDVELAAIDRGSCPEARAVLEGLDDTSGDPIDELWSAWSTADSLGDEGLSSGN